MEKLAEIFHVKHPTGLQQGLAERLGTLVLVMFGCGAVAQMALSRGTHSTFLTVNLAFGFAMLGILVSGQVRAVGSWPVDGKATRAIFTTYPSEHLTLLNGFFDQVIGTAALLVCILAIVDPHNNPVPGGLEAFTVGLVVLAVGLSMRFNSGYAVNPARDLGPRLFTALAGWGSEVFTGNGYWFLVPLTAPFLGAVVGAAVYQLTVGYSTEGEARCKKRRVEDVTTTTTTTTTEEA
ncbi:hypothetical protein NHX12_027460 [Muraenolepis orangiensis]|uniref:Aquaporin-3 n=1 Tax=Muraenolepis orangiensis TaxID=630683 RepID=A0A9Q0IP90_9TELE|nr:hypothetical protein NHX12_027460 [Muraenolepis orangiensis]